MSRVPSGCKKTVKKTPSTSLGINVCTYKIKLIVDFEKKKIKNLIQIFQTFV